MRTKNKLFLLFFIVPFISFSQSQRFSRDLIWTGLEQVQIAENETIIAINLIETELDKFFEETYSNPMQSYSNNIERSRMFLAYLYYKTGNNEKALYNFELAITSKEQGSTFMGDWDYWLNYRDYYKDEHEVLLKLKEMYLEKQKQ